MRRLRLSVLAVPVETARQLDEATDEHDMFPVGNENRLGVR